MVVSDLTQDWWSVLVSSVKKGWDILHKQDDSIDPVCLEHEQWQSCVKTCGDWSGLQLHFILHCCSVSMQHQGAAVTMLQSVNTAGIITGCRLRLMMAALGSPGRYCQAHDNIWEERMARSKTWRWTWMRVREQRFFLPGDNFLVLGSIWMTGNGQLIRYCSKASLPGHCSAHILLLQCCRLQSWCCSIHYWTQERDTGPDRAVFLSMSIQGWIFLHLDLVV